MGKQIDEKVVEMRFDNKQFEQGASQTINTLQKLKQSLKLEEAAKGFNELDKAANNVDLKGIAAGVDSLQKRFSVMGIASMRVIENITDSLMGLANKGFSYMEEKIVSGGIRRAMNIENAHFSLQALLKDEQKVQAIMADANASVDGTAYSYDEAAKAAASFAATGIESGEKMLGALKAIAGTAAMTNSDYASMSQIFTTVAGQGRLMGDQLLQLSSRGMNAAATLADYFKEVKGQASMTEGTIRDMVSKGKIDFNTFAEAMNWAFGESAERANETFTGAMSNIGAAFARIGAGFVSPFIEQNGEMVELLNAIRVKVNEVKSVLVFDEQTNALRGMVDEAKLMDETYAQFALTAGEGFDSILHKILETNGKLGGEFDKRYASMTQMWQEMTSESAITLDQIKDMDTWGFRATNSLREYFTGIANGSIDASDQMTESVKKMVGDVTVLNSDVDKWVKEGLVNFDMFQAAFAHANREAIDSAGGLETALKGMFSEVKSAGFLTADAMDKFAANGFDTGKALSQYMVGVKNGTIRASYATRQAIEEIASDTGLAAVNMKGLAEESKITSDIFVSAMSNMYGDGEFMSKKFTDYFLDKIGQVKEALKNFNASEFAEGLSYVFESIFNVGTAIVSYIEPILKAFGNVFSSGKGFNDTAAAIENFTAKLKLSERGSKDLEDTFTGLLSIVSLLVDGLFKIIGIFVKVEVPIEATGNGILGLTGYIGRLLTAFSKMVRESRGVKKAFDLLSTGIKTIIRWCKNLGVQIEKLSIWFYNLEPVQNVIHGLTESFDEFVDRVIYSSENMGEALENVSKLIESMIPDEVKETVDDFLETFESFDLKNPTDWFTKLGEAIDRLGDRIRKNEHIDKFFKFFEDLGNKDADNIVKIGDILGGFGKKISDFFGNLNWGGVLAAGGGAGIIYILYEIAKALTKFSTSVTNIPDAVVGTLKSLQGALSSYQKNLEAERLLTLAKAILMIAGAMIALSFLSPEKLVLTASAIALVGWMLTNGFVQIKAAIDAGKTAVKPLDNLTNSFSSTISNLGKAAKKWATGKMIKDFASSVLEIALAIGGLGYLYHKDPEAFKAASALVTGIGAFLIVVMELSDISSKTVNVTSIAQLKTIGDVMKEFATSMLIVVASLALLMNVDFGSDWKIKIGVLAGIIAELSLVAITISKFGQVGAGKHTADVGKTMLAMGAMMLLVVKSLSMLMDIQFTDHWGVKLGVLAGIIASLTGVAIALAKFGQTSNGQKTVSVAGTLLAMAGMMFAVVKALDMLMQMQFTEGWVGKLVILAGIIGGLTLVVKSIGEAESGGSLKAAGTILALSVMLFAIVGSLSFLNKMKPNELIKSIIALGVVLTLLKGTFEGIGSITKGDPWKSVLALGGALLAITIALGVLSLIPVEGLIKSVIALGVVLKLLGGTFEDMNEINNGKNAWKSLVAFCGVLLVVAGSLYALSGRDWKGILVSAVAIGLVLEAFGRTMGFISKSTFTTKNSQKLLAIAEMAGVLLIIAGSLYILSNQPWENMLASAASISAVLLAITGSLVILDKFKINPAAAGEAGLAIDTFVAVLGALVVAMGAIQKLLEAVGGGDLLDKGIEVLGKIGDAIGAFLGGIVGGALEGAIEGIASGLPSLGMSLSQFAAFASPFFAFVNGLPEDTSSKTGQLALAIMAMAGADVISGIANFIPFAGDFSAMGTNLSEFAESAKGFFKTIKDINPESIEACKNLASMIVMLTAADVISGIANFLPFIGKSSLKDFADELVEAGPSIADFANIVKDVKKSDVEGAIAAIEVISGAANKLQGTGGLLQKIFGEKSLKDFAEQLDAMAPSLVSFVEQTTGITKDSVLGAAEACALMAECANKLPPTPGNLIGFLFGDHDIRDFGERLVSFGSSMLLFSIFVSGIKEDAANGVGTVTSIMTDLANNLPTDGGLIGAIFGGTISIADFGKQMNTFAFWMKSACTYLSQIETGKTTASIEVLRSLVDVVKDLQGVDGSLLIDFTNSLSSIAEDCVIQFLNAFSESPEAVNTAVNTFTLNIINSLITKRTEYYTEGLTGSLSYIQGWQFQFATATLTGITMSMNVLAGLRNIRSLGRFYQEGVDSALEYLRGIRSRYQEAFSTGTTLASNVANGIRSNISQFYSAGAAAGQGFVDGVKSKEGAARAAGAALGRAAAEAAKAALDEHSPSRVMRKIASLGGEGFVLGLKEWVSRAFKEGTALGEESTNGARLGIQNVQDLLENMEDPVIRPIMDLTDLKASMNDIGRKFNDVVYKTNLNVNAASVSMNKQSSHAPTNESDQNGSGNVYNNYSFNQVNNSPKALSRIDIYRNTENQFARFKEVTKK